MKVTYVEAADTWVISYVLNEEEAELKKFINVFRFSDAKYLVIPGDFEVMEKESRASIQKSARTYKTCKVTVKNKMNIGETNKNTPIYEPSVAKDLEMIATSLSNATKDSARMIVIPERNICTDIEKLYKVLQLMGVGCFIQSCYSSDSSTIERALRIFNDEGEINL